MNKLSQCPYAMVLVGTIYIYDNNYLLPEWLVNLHKTVYT